jgi:hypothetical protein
LRSGFFVIFSGFVLLLMETAWGPGVQFGLIRPDGLIALLVWHALRSRLPDGILPVLGLGILTEAFTILPWGLYILAYAGGYLAVRYVVSHVMCVYLWQKMLMVSFVSVGFLVIVLTGSGVADLFWPWGLIQAILNGLICPAFFFCLDSLQSYILSAAPSSGKRRAE